MVDLAQLPTALGIVHFPGQVADGAVGVTQREGVLQRRPRLDGQSGLEEDLHVHAQQHDVVDPDGLRVQVQRRMVRFGGRQQIFGPLGKPGGDANLPLPGIAGLSPLQLGAPLVANAPGLLAGREVPEFEPDGLFSGPQVGASVPLHIPPGPEQDVGDVSERDSISRLQVSADAGGDP